MCYGYRYEGGVERGGCVMGIYMRAGVERGGCVMGIDMRAG